MKVLTRRWDAGEVPPFGCRWCGDERHHHGWSWVPGNGLHQWVMPTQAQIKARMRARAVARLMNWPE